MNTITNVRPPTRIPKSPDEERMRSLSCQAEQWAHFAQRQSSLSEDYLIRKSAESVRHALRSRTTSFGIYTKLCGTGKHREALEMLRGFGLMRGHLVQATPVNGQLHMSVAGMSIGLLDPCHSGWLEPLLAHGAQVQYLRVTGGHSPYQSCGCNVLISRITPAIKTLTQTHARQRDQQLEELVEEDIRLRRDERGRACTNIAHFRRHGEEIDWGHDSPGASDLARSILIRFVGLQAAEPLYERFARDIISKLPTEGGLIEAAFVRSWLTEQAA